VRLSIEMRLGGVVGLTEIVDCVPQHPQVARVPPRVRSSELSASSAGALERRADAASRAARAACDPT
jgi:hypothetical protein